MPGSIITCTGLPSTYNSFYMAQNATSSGFAGLTIDASTDTFNVGVPASNFPFLTGETVYYAFTAANLTLVTRYYAIRLSSTSIKLATSVANAFAGTAVDLTTNSLSTNTANNQHQISNVMMLLHSGPDFSYNNIFNRANYQGSAYSTINFSITENIRFEFTIDAYTFAGIVTTTETYGIGVGIAKSSGPNNAILGREWNDSTNIGRWQMGSAGVITSARITLTISNRVVTVATGTVATGGITYYTTATITNTEQFRFFAYFSLNNTAVRDCVITYL